MNKKMLIGVALAAGILALGLTVFAFRNNNVSEIRELARSGSGESAMLAVVEKSSSPFKLSADDIIGMKKEGVPDSVVIRMLNHNP